MVSTHLWKTIVPIWRQKSFPPQGFEVNKKNHAVGPRGVFNSSGLISPILFICSFIWLESMPLAAGPPMFFIIDSLGVNFMVRFIHGCFCWNEEFLGIFGWQIYEHEDASWAWLDIMSMTENREKTSWTWERKINYFELISNVFFHTVTVSHKIRRWPTLW